MMRLATLLCTLLLVFTCAACEPKAETTDGQGQQDQAGQEDDYAESSASFEPGTVQPFLQRMIGLFDDGFGQAEVAAVMKAFDEIQPENELDLEFSVTYQGEHAPLSVTLRKDAESEPELYFVTTPKVAERLDALMDQYAQEVDKQEEAKPGPAQPGAPAQPVPPAPNGAPLKPGTPAPPAPAQPVAPAPPGGSTGSGQPQNPGE